MKLVCCILALLASAALGAEPEVKPEDLVRTKPVEAADAIKTFKIRPGLHIELAAAEPLVVDPIAMCFDEDGRLFVVEMRDYSERRAEKLGRIRMLTDTDGDGKFDKATIFLDHLPWPTAVFYCNGGVLVGACPDILFAKDTNGDGVADDVKTLFTGFGSTQERLNVQGLFNNFIWGFDNRIHGCSGHDGGMIAPATNPTKPTAPPWGPLDVRNKGFVINPRDWTMQTENGGGQYGLSFDPAGRMFTCTNSSHIETFMYDGRYAGANPNYAMPEPRIGIAADGPAAEVFRISPEEPWRVIRTRWRIAGLVAGPVEGGGRSAGYFTGATGITIYRGDAFGPEYVGDAFVGDAGGNLVHHKRIRRGSDGLQPIAERPADEKSIEFCASNDTWFRPVDFANAPDGTLYIADMYREVIEHPWSLPPAIKKYLDLNSGNDRGRIYRLAPDGFAPRKPPHLSAATVAELVATLENPNGWHRETASRLIFERQNKSAVPLLANLLANSKFPLARLHALHTLHGLGALDAATLTAATKDADLNVRAHAIALSPPDANLADLADDPAIEVRYQLALTLGTSRDPLRSQVLAQLIQRDTSNRWMRAAVLNSVGDDAGEIFQRLAANKPDKTFLRELAQIIGAQNHADAIALVLAYVKSSRDLASACGLAEGADRAGALAALRPGLKECFESARTAAMDSKLTPDARVDAITLLGFADGSDATPVLLKLLDPHQPQRAMLAAVASLDRVADESTIDEILKRAANLPPRVRSEAIGILVKRPDRAMRLLHAIETGAVKQSDLSAAQINQLLTTSEGEVRSRARNILKVPSTQRGEVVEAFRAALSLSGDPQRGHAIFQQRCASCHRAGTDGFAIGPDLVSVRNSGKEKLLVSILDPSREVAPAYINYIIETTDGDAQVGILASDTPAGLMIRQPLGRETIVPRAKIKRMRSAGKSLMPDGLEAGLSIQDVADLLEFVTTFGAK